MLYVLMRKHEAVLRERLTGVLRRSFVSQSRGVQRGMIQMHGGGVGVDAFEIINNLLNLLIKMDFISSVYLCVWE